MFSSDSGLSSDRRIRVVSSFSKVGLKFTIRLTGNLVFMEESTSSSLQLHRTESFPSNNLMMGHNRHRPFLSSPNGGDDDGGGGPNQNDSGANEVERPRPPAPTSTTTRGTCSNILFRGDAGAAAVPNISWSASGGSAAAAFAATVNTLQPFDSCLSNNKAFKFPGGGEMAAALGFPFTAAQWKELERQAMIYKYMMAAVSVPSDLLLPADPTTTPPLGNNNGSLYNLRYPNRDLEPGRCKRTDGKKWRCSRDVAPHQKYCERHMHRGRPRSRKPVELHSSSVVDSNNNNSGKKSRLNQSTLHSPPTPPKPNAQANTTYSTPLLQPKDAPVLDSTGCQNIFASSTYKEPNRVFGWAMENEVAAVANEVEQHWHHLMDTKKGVPTEDSIYGSNASILQQGYGEEPLNLFSYADFVPENIDNRNDHCQLFLNSDLVSSKHPHVDQNCTSRGFIDAWSDGDLKTIDESSVLSSEGNNLSPSSLTLSMATVAGNAIDEGMKLASDPDHHKPKDCPVSWLPFNSGGPLAEVLQPSSIASGSNPASPYNSNGDSSPPATTVSSPTGIFNKALLFSHSDSSVCNSPTLAASAAPPEVVAFRWLS